MPKDVNLTYYNLRQPGRDDYWTHMAAPRFRRKTILRLLDRMNAASAVDLGCGGGNLLVELHRRFPAWRLAGVDSSSVQIEENRSALTGFEWIVADLSQEKWVPTAGSALFDVVIGTEIIEHVENPLAFLVNARRWARPDGGTLILSTQSGPMTVTEQRVGHRRHFSPTEMDSLLREAGWTPVRLWNGGFPFHDLSKRLANLAPDLAMGHFSGREYGWVHRAVCGILRMLFLLNSGQRGAQLFSVAENKSPVLKS